MIITATRHQILTALADMPAPYWYDSVSADPNDTVWIELNSAQLVRVGDPLYVKLQIALGYTSAQMLTLFDAAVQVPQ